MPRKQWRSLNGLGSQFGQRYRHSRAANTIGLPIRLGVVDTGRLIISEKTRGLDFACFAQSNDRRQAAAAAAYLRRFLPYGRTRMMRFTGPMRVRRDLRVVERDLLGSAVWAELRAIDVRASVDDTAGARNVTANDYEPAQIGNGEGGAPLHAMPDAKRAKLLAKRAPADIALEKFADAAADMTTSLGRRQVRDSPHRSAGAQPGVFARPGRRATLGGPSGGAGVLLRQPECFEVVVLGSHLADWRE